MLLFQFFYLLPGYMEAKVAQKDKILAKFAFLLFIPLGPAFQ